jgi:hypothetical protein
MIMDKGRLEMQLYDLRRLENSAHIITTQADRELVFHMIRVLETLLDAPASPSPTRHHT